MWPVFLQKTFWGVDITRSAWERLLSPFYTGNTKQGFLIPHNLTKLGLQENLDTDSHYDCITLFYKCVPQSAWWCLRWALQHTPLRDDEAVLLGTFPALEFRNILGSSSEIKLSRYSPCYFLQSSFREKHFYPFNHLFSGDDVSEP